MKITDKLTITNEDNMQLMSRYPDNYFELAIVDPPYGIGLEFIKIHGNKNHGGQRESILKHNVKDWNNFIPSKEYFEELHRISKHQIIWGCNYYAQYIPAIGRIVHDKIMPSEANDSFKFSHADLASCSLQNRITMFRYQWAGNRQNGTINWKNNGVDGRIHPTQKPVALYKWLLDKYAKPGDKILDTHLGSGSIALACHDYGFELTACELDTEYYDKAVQRIQNHVAQQKLF